MLLYSKDEVIFVIVLHYNLVCDVYVIVRDLSCADIAQALAINIFAEIYNCLIQYNLNRKFD